MCFIYSMLSNKYSIIESNFSCTLFLLSTLPTFLFLHFNNIPNLDIELFFFRYCVDVLLFFSHNICFLYQESLGLIEAHLHHVQGAINVISIIASDA